MKNAFIYLRVSGNCQLDGYGFDRQEETCREFAERNGYEIVGVFKEEAISGTKDEDERPAFQEMLSDILGNCVRTIIIEGMDRLARAYRIQEQLIIYIASKGIDLINARTGENITEALEGDPMKRALIQLQGVFAELEKNLLVMRLKKGRERKKAVSGRCEGRKFYGETPEETEIVKKIKLWRRNTRGGHKGLTLQQICDRLNAEGVPTRLGKRWRPQQIANILRK